MKPTRFNTMVKNMLLGIFAMMILFSFDSCTKKENFLNSAIVPAARGFVQVRRDRNKNFVIKVVLSDLAEVQRLQPPKQSYVVWMLTDQGITKNMGRLNSSTGLFSKTLKASFRTVSTFNPSKIFITAEDDASIQYPVGQIIITTDRF